MSSGYGTLSAWETGLDHAEGEEEEEEEEGEGKEERRWSPLLLLQEDKDTAVIGGRQSSSNETPRPHQLITSGPGQLTSWAQRHKLRPKKARAGQTSPLVPEYQELPLSPRETPRHPPLETPEPPDQYRLAGPSNTLRRSDSLVSEASGLTYWRLDESELYRPLPDSFDSGAYLLLQDATLSLTPPPEQRPSLREIYQKQKTDSKRTDWDHSLTCSPLSPQVLTLDPTAHPRHSDRTSGFTSPSRFSSPSLPAQPPLYPPGGGGTTPVSPGSAPEGNPGDTDCSSDASSLSGHAPAAGHAPWAPLPHQGVHHGAPPPRCLAVSQQRRASAPLASEEEGSNTHTSTLKPSPPRPGEPHVERASSLEDPVVLSLLRQNLREKHSRHVADLKAYYESEVRGLREKLQLRDLPRDLERSNQALRERCEHLEEALAEATSHIHELEAKNLTLEKKLAEWPERYAVAGAAVKSLQQRLEDSRRAGGEQEVQAACLRTHTRQLEEALHTACREAEEKDARREREYKMLQDLLGEYDTLRKDSDGVKDNLVSAENKLVDAGEQISELKRVISKLESQIMQLEHESQARLRHVSHSHAQASGAGLFHHPDLLLSPSKRRPEPDVPHRKSPCRTVDQPNVNKKSAFPHASQSNGYRKCAGSQPDQSAGSGGSVGGSTGGGSWRCTSPPEREQTQEQSGVPPREPCPLTPVMRALIELEETRTTESRAPWLAGRRSTVGFVDQRHREPPDRDAGPERAPPPKAQRSLSPKGHRSSSLPPPHQRTFPPATPTKRETLLMPVSARSSPKRSPTENYSTAFDLPSPRQPHLHNRLDVPLDSPSRRHSFHSSSPRKRLHFTCSDRREDSQQSCTVAVDSSGAANPSEGGSQLGWETQGAWGRGRDPQDTRGRGRDPQDTRGRGQDPQDAWGNRGQDPQDAWGSRGQDAGEEAAPSPPVRLHSLADAERLFDELTQEKLQIEAALSRIPGMGGRVSLQTRLDEVALEKRLEIVNRDLGSIRMTLKRFHVLRSSANI